jgi:hypothetical protein
MGCESDHLGNNMGSRRFTFQKLKGGSTPKNPIPSARRLRRASKPALGSDRGLALGSDRGKPQYFAADPRLRKDDADPDYSGYGSNDSMGGETGRYLKWIGED